MNMEFSPANPVVRLCVEGMDMETKERSEDAARLFRQAWNEAASLFEKYIAAYFMARHQKSAPDKIEWLERKLKLASDLNDDAVKAAFPSLYSALASSYEEMNDADNAKKYRDLAKTFVDEISDKGPFYHGTKADLKTGDLLTPGGKSNYKAELTMNHIYFTALAHGAGLAASLAKGDGRERVYVVEPTGPFENDPNVTNKKFPGNPTRSYRTSSPLKIVGEITDWSRQTPEELRQWREKLANNKGEIIN
jgi:hypothetical protein